MLMILRLFSLFEIPKGDTYVIFKIYQICTFFSIKQLLYQTLDYTHI
jgi:hypothetical protein